jgi:hypothetical protein
VRFCTINSTDDGYGGEALANIHARSPSVTGMTRFHFLTVVGCMMMAAVPSQAAVVWSSGPDNLSTGGDNLVFSIVQQFQMTSPTQLTELLFWQGEFATVPDPSDTYIWSIRSDVAGSPGAFLDIGSTSTYTRTLFGSFVLGGFDVNSYEIDFAMNSGWYAAGTYWLQLSSSTGVAFWDVARSCSGTCPDGVLPGFESPSSPNPHGFEYAFQLSGTGAPEPGTVGLVLSAGIAGLLWRRRRA